MGKLLLLFTACSLINLSGCRPKDDFKPRAYSLLSGVSDSAVYYHDSVLSITANATATHFPFKITFEIKHIATGKVIFSESASPGNLSYTRAFTVQFDTLQHPIGAYRAVLTAYSDGGMDESKRIIYLDHRPGFKSGADYVYYTTGKLSFYSQNDIMFNQIILGNYYSKLVPFAGNVVCVGSKIDCYSNKGKRLWGFSLSSDALHPQVVGGAFYYAENSTPASVVGVNFAGNEFLRIQSLNGAIIHFLVTQTHVFTVEVFNSNYIINAFHLSTGLFDFKLTYPGIYIPYLFTMIDDPDNIYLLSQYHDDYSIARYNMPSASSATLGMFSARSPLSFAPFAISSLQIGIVNGDLLKSFNINSGSKYAEKYIERGIYDFYVDSDKKKIWVLTRDNLEIYDLSFKLISTQQLPSSSIRSFADFR
jgi:hypothetical protein